MDQIRDDALEFMRNLNPHHFYFGELGTAHNMIFTRKVSLLVLASDCKNWGLHTIIVMAYYKDIPVLFVESGEELARVCRTGENYIMSGLALNIYNDEQFTEIKEKIWKMTPEELLPQDWGRDDLLRRFKAIHQRYAGHRMLRQ